jgi:hypothetical protein
MGHWDYVIPAAPQLRNQYARSVLPTYNILQAANDKCKQRMEFGSAFRQRFDRGGRLSDKTRRAKLSVGAMGNKTVHTGTWHQLAFAANALSSRRVATAVDSSAE